MKRLILSGGKPTESKRWVDALLCQANGEARIGLCLFAGEDSKIQTAMEHGVTEVIKHWAGNTKVECQTLTPDNFVKVSNWANIIVIPGGDSQKLYNELTPQGDLMQLWDGKTISGSSAGADIMCRRYVYLQDKTFHQGFGWVQANFIPHWLADWEGWDYKTWQWAVNELATQPGQVPLLLVREGEFVEIAVQ